VLGDDIVIADPEVAEEYLRVMKLLGVGIGLHKSLISRNRLVLEFAKKYYVDGQNCSMIPFKEIIATRTFHQLGVEFMRKYDLTFPSLVSMLSYGFRVQGSLCKDLRRMNRRVASLYVYSTRPSSIDPEE